MVRYLYAFSIGDHENDHYLIGKFKYDGASEESRAQAEKEMSEAIDEHVWTEYEVKKIDEVRDDLLILDAIKPSLGIRISYTAKLPEEDEEDEFEIN